MSPEQLKKRTKAYALEVMRQVDVLPKEVCASVLGRQLLRSGTSVGANYRAACRARSHADFISKLGICEEEADETLYWMELLTESGKVPKETMASLMKEGNEILAIICASLNTARSRS